MDIIGGDTSGDHRRVLEGVVALADVDTGQAIRFAVLIAMDADTITYTAQTIDRSHQETAQTPRSEATYFLRVMEMIERVGHPAGLDRA